MQRFKQRPSAVLALVIAIPLLSLITGSAMLYLAHRSDASVPVATTESLTRNPLSKTSWRGAEQP